MLTDQIKLTDGTILDNTELGSVDGVTSDLQTQIDAKIAVSEKGVAAGVATLDGAGKVPAIQMPATAITETSVVANEAGMLALTAQTGDVAIRSDLNKSFILQGTDPSILNNWQELLTPTDAVLSVNGQVGTVSLSAADITNAADKSATNIFTQNQTIKKDFPILDMQDDTGSAGAQIRIRDAAGSNRGILEYIENTTTPGNSYVQFRVLNASSTNKASVQMFEDGRAAISNFATSTTLQLNTDGTTSLTGTVFDIFSTQPEVRLFETDATNNNFAIRVSAGAFRLAKISDSGATSFEPLFVESSAKQLRLASADVLYDGQVLAREGRANTFTQIQKFTARPEIEMAPQPKLLFNETDQGADLKKWELLVSGGAFFIRTLTDSEGSASNKIQISNNSQQLVLNSADITYGGQSLTAYKPLSINTQSGTAYTLVLADAGKYIRMNSSSANTLTVPNSTSVAFDIGTEIVVRQSGSGQTTIVAASGVVINTSGSLNIAAQHDSVSLIYIGSNTWDLMGATA